MLYGWTGTNLEVDLSRGKTEKVKGDPELVKAYLGGKGTNAKIFWDRIPPEVDAFSPDNLLIIGAGLLSGTMVPGATNTCITFKSPLTDTHHYSNIKGFFAPELKHAGYDTIVISGKSPTPVYLLIRDDDVEIRDANHLWGKDTRETQRLIREELKNDKVQTICIGPPGENRVYAASIEHSTGASASRGGVGAVMGDKNLKAITVYGTKDVSVANPSKLFELCEYINNRTDPVRSELLDPYGYGVKFVGNVLRWGNFGNFGEPISAEFMEQVKRGGETAKNYMETKRVREVGCYNCGLRCKHAYPVPGGIYSFIKCGNWVWPMIVAQVIDFDFNMAFYSLCEKYGFDVWSVSSYINFAIDLYQRGILTKEDTDGMHLEWGNPEVAFTLLEKIARREGIGDVLANGVYRAARQIGKGAENYAYHMKKNEEIPFEIIGPKAAIADAMSDRGDMTRFDNTMLSRFFGRSKEEKEEFIKRGFFPYPKEFEKYFFEDYDYTGQNYEPLLQMMTRDEQTYAIADSVGLCYFWVRWWYLSPINNDYLKADLISAATGMDVDETKAEEIAKRIINLVRACNVREGIRRKDDKPAEVLFQRTPPPPYLRLEDTTLFDKWIDRFYEIRGWNSDGIPTKATLEEFGLDYASQELQQRGILTD